MRLPRFTASFLALACLPLILSCSQTPQKQFEHWPALTPATQPNPQQEAAIEDILGQLTLEQKVAQMIQADIASVTIEEIERYRIGSVLNGGGQTPDNNRQATAQQWVELAEALYQASMKPADGVVPIPIIWGTDAVHGHGNVRGATLFPHNIGLGATRNTALVRDIATATAREIAATGLDWNFAPTVAVARDDRWGRTYESFAENPDLVASLGAAVVEGLQGRVDSQSFLDERRVVATAKHFIGDGGTEYGDDQGFVVGDEDALLDIHLPGYITSLRAGVQTVMASYSWWNGVHSHENARLMNGLLKKQLGFDGVIVSDWQAIGQVPGCTIDSCPQAINAGVDLFMIPNAPDWKQFYRNTLQQVRSGQVALARIDDAVRRILRVKMRAGLWDKPSPANRALAGQQEWIGAAEHRTLARQAVRESLVLLKNNDVLPIAGNARVAVVGPGADDLAMQSGGWSVTWQGTELSNEDFPGATSIRKGVERALSQFGGTLVSAESDQEKPDVAIVVFGETPYAELSGDIENLSTLEVEQGNKTGLELIKQFKKRDVPVVAVMLSGRPLWSNKELNAADAFVAAWLPGSEGHGVADVLIGDQSGNVRHDFQGRLSFSWPAGPCDAQSHTDGETKPLFRFGYGLDYNSHSKWIPLNESTRQWRFGCLLGEQAPPAASYAFEPASGWRFYAESKTNTRKAIDAATTLGAVSAEPLADEKRYGVKANWDGSALGRVILRNGQPDNHFVPHLANDGVLAFDVQLHSPPHQDLFLVTFSGLSAATLLDMRPIMDDLPRNQWTTVRISLACLANDRLDFNEVGAPFSLQSTGQLALSVANVRYAVDSTETLDMKCDYQH